MGNGSWTSWYWNFSCGGGGGDSAPPAPLPQLKKLRGVTKLGLVEAMAALPLAMNAAMMQLDLLIRGGREDIDETSGLKPGNSIS
jgi:hypothetical protein